MLLKTIPTVCGDNVSKEPLLKNRSGNCFTLVSESHDTTLQWQLLFVQITGTTFAWLRKIGRADFRNFYFLLHNFWGRISLKVSKCFQERFSKNWKHTAAPLFSFWFWISLTENSFASLPKEVSVILMKFLSFYVTTITFSASTKSTQ